MQGYAELGKHRKLDSKKRWTRKPVGRFVGASAWSARRRRAGPSLRPRDAVYSGILGNGLQIRQILEEPGPVSRNEQVGRLVVIDEVQFLPDLFKVACVGQVDRRRRKGFPNRGNFC